MWLSFVSQNCYGIAILPGNCENRSGLGVAKSEGLKQTKTENKSIRKPLPDQGNQRYTYLPQGFPHNFPNTNRKNWLIQQGLGYLSKKLDSNLHIRLPHFYFDRKDFEKGTWGSILNGNYYTRMAYTNMVSEVTPNVFQELSPSSRELEPFNGTSRKSLPAD